MSRSYKPVRPKVEAFMRQSTGRLSAEDVRQGTKGLKLQSVRYALDTLAKEGLVAKHRSGTNVFFEWGGTPTETTKVLDTPVKNIDARYDIEYVGTMDNGAVVVRDMEDALYRLERI